MAGRMRMKAWWNEEENEKARKDGCLKVVFKTAKQ